MTILGLKSQSNRLRLSPRRRGAPDGGGGPPGDTEAPSVPQDLSATAVSDDQIDLTWDASTDNVGVTGYNIYRDEVLVDTSPTNAYSDTGLAPGTEYEYEVSAFDAASNESARSAPDSATTHQVIVTDGLIAEWRFDEGSGTTAADSSGNGHNITGLDGSWETGGFIFNPPTQQGPGSNLGISGTQARTVCLAIKPTVTPQIRTEWVGSGASFTRWTMREKGSDTELRLEVAGAGHSFEGAGMDLIASTWQFVAVTQSGANLNTAVGYVDGASEACTTSATINTAGNFVFGQNAGTLGYALVYNRALSPAEVEQNRQALKSILAARGITLPS